jgi:hypothetical protein
MDEQRRQEIVDRLRERGFDIGRLTRTPHGNRED